MDFHTIVLVYENTVYQCHGNAALQFRDILMQSEPRHPFTVFSAVLLELHKGFLQSIHLLFTLGGASGVVLFKPCVFVSVDDAVCEVLIERH